MSDKRFVVSKDMMTTELNIATEKEKVADAAALRGLNTRISSLETDRVTGVKGNAESTYRTGYVNITSSQIGAIPTSEKGSTGGVAELDNSGHVPSSQLPSYVDDIVEGYYKSANGKFYKESTYTTEIPGEEGKIYISLDTNLPYRWSGSAFVQIPWGLALGETSSTAYRGDRGKKAYDQSNTNKTSISTLDADFAGVETNASSSSMAYAIGDYLVLSHKLYRVTAAISQGAAIAEGTNVERVTITDELGSKQDKLTAKGSATQGVYVDSNGELQPMAHTVEKSVPSDAVFTDTNDKVKQTITSTNNAGYRLLMSYTADDTTRTEGVRKNSNLKYNPSKDELHTKKISGVAYNQLLTGTGTAGEDKGSSVTPRYFPSKWTFDTGRTPADGDIITIKIPVAGITYGVYLSIDNGTTYKPVALYGTTRLTTQYAVDMYIRLIYDENASVASIYNIDGGNASETVTGGAWRVINFYDTNTTYNPQKLGFGYGTCTTAAATAAKEASLTDYTLVKNGIVSIKFSYAVPANATLNINSKGAKAIYYHGSAIVDDVIPAGAIATFIYSTYYHLIAIDIGGGAGHTVLDSSGTALPQEKSLQFVGMNAEDDSTNRKTIVHGQLVKVTQAQYEALSAAQKNDPNTTWMITDTEAAQGISASITISTTGWSSTTTTVDGVAYYTHETALSSVFDSHPDIQLGALGTVPTSAEKTAFGNVYYIRVDTSTNKLICYATAKPGANFVIVVKGVSV